MSNLAIEAALGQTWSGGQRHIFKRVMSQSDIRVGEGAVIDRLSLSSGGYLYPREGMMDRQQASESTEQRSLRVEVDQLVVNPMWLTGGNIAVSGVAGAVSPDYRVFTSSARVEPRFLHHLLRSKPYRDQYDLFVRANTTFDRRIQQQDLDQMPLRLPPRDEQRRIADFLDDRVARIDRIIEARRSQLGALAELGRSRREGAVLGRNRLSTCPASWAPFGRIPTGWREGRLRRLRCRVQTGPFGSQLHSDEYEADGWPVINPASITDTGLVALPHMAVGDATRERLSRHVLQPGDVVFGRRGDLGRAALVTQAERGWLCGTGSLAVRLEDRRLDPAFLVLLLRTAPVRAYFDQQSVGSTMDNLNTDILLGVPLLMPSPEEQRQVVAKVCGLDEEEGDASDAMRTSIGIWTEYKQSLITAAVTGELDVTTAGSGIPG